MTSGLLYAYLVIFVYTCVGRTKNGNEGFFLLYCCWLGDGKKPYGSKIVVERLLHTIIQIIELYIYIKNID